MRDKENGFGRNLLQTVSMRELYENVYPGKTPVIDGLLFGGTYLFVGAPKIGKSFLMAQIAYHVSTGMPLWDFPVHKGTVLYLALEDDFSRLQERMYRMFGTESAENLHFSIASVKLNEGLDEQLADFIEQHPDTKLIIIDTVLYLALEDEYRRLQERLFRMFGVEGTDELYFATSVRQLGGGLQEQLDRFVRDHPNTKLIIIDTLQKVRENGGDRYSYASDYDIVSQLKSFADQRGICLLLVHHTRKQQADNKFDMISGTNGLLGAADGAFMLQKEKRTGNAATLEVSGRDQQDQKLHLVRNPESLIWELESVETELWKEPPDPILEAVARMMTDQSWTGTPSQLVEDLNLDLPPNALTKRLNVKASHLESEYGIRYESKRTHAGRRIILNRISREA